MRKLILSVALVFLMNLGIYRSQAALQFSITTNVMIDTVYDSFDEGLAGNGHFCYDEAALQLGYPQVTWRGRMSSQAGQSNLGFVTNNLPAISLPLAGSMHGTNDVWFWYGVSGNGGFASTANTNWYQTNMERELQFPMTNWTVYGYFTNDWPWTTNNLHWTVFADSTYYGNAAGADSVYKYSGAGSNAGFVFRVPFVDSTAHTSYETNQYNSDTNLAAGNYYHADNTPPDLSHPRRDRLQFVRHLLDYQQLGGDTNIFSWIQDWNSSSVAASATNQCSVGSITKTTYSFSAPFRANRLGGPVEIGDATHTNDDRPMFVLVPSTTNFFSELIVFSNAPAGKFVWNLDGISVMTNDSVNGMISNNFYHTYCGAWFNQKMAVLDTYRTVRDISTTNAAVYVSTLYQKNFNNHVGNNWPGNAGTAAYTAAMLQYETPMETIDAIGFAAAQQTTHILTVNLLQPAFAPFH